MKKELANNPELAQQLSDPKLDESQKQEMLNAVAVTVMKELGYVPNETKVVSTDEPGRDAEQVKGHYNKGTNTNYINDKNNKDTNDLVATTGHEITHAMDRQEGTFKAGDADQNTYANNFGADLASYTDAALDYTHDTSLANTNNHTKPKSLEAHLQLQQNNQEFKNVDKQEGDNLTIFVHGTYSSPKEADKDFLDAVGKTYNEEVYQFDWSGKNGEPNGDCAENRKEAREHAGSRLAEYVENYEFKDGEKLNIVGHSHGGNVIKDFTQYYEGDKKIDNATLMGTPNRDDHFLNYNNFEKDAKITNVYDTSDMVQRLGGIDAQKNYGINIDRIGIGNRIINNSKVKNIEVESGSHPFNSHSNLDAENVWKQFND